jgi:hypothetical protein
LQAKLCWLDCVFYMSGHSIYLSFGFYLRMLCLYIERRLLLLVYWRLVEWMNGLWLRNSEMFLRLKQELKHSRNLDSGLKTGINWYYSLRYSRAFDKFLSCNCVAIFTITENCDLSNWCDLNCGRIYVAETSETLMLRFQTF